MDLQELYEIITKLIEQGKGDYDVLIKFEEMECVSRSYGVDIEDNTKDIVINAV